MKKELMEIAELGQQFSENVNVKKVIEQDVIPVTVVTTTATLTTSKRTVSRCSEMELWVGAIEENIASGSSVTFKFYKVVDGTEFLCETLVVSVPAVTAGTSAKASVLPLTADIESFDFYSIEGSVTVVNGGGIKLLVGKKSQG